MDRQSPRTTSDAIDLYIRTYYSLLRSTGDVRVRAFEEAHLYSNSSLHAGALEAETDVAAFAYSAARLPACMPSVRRLVLGQSIEQFEFAGLAVRDWETVTSRGRRRAMRYDGQATLAVFVTSVSDIDDLIPIVSAYQIEWNKMHEQLRMADSQLLRDADDVGEDQVARAVGVDEAGAATLISALGKDWLGALAAIAAEPLDLGIRLLDGSFNQYQRSAARWWAGISSSYATGREKRPVYFVSSNTHSLVNLVGGYAHHHRERIIEFARERNPENLAPVLEDALARGNEDMVSSLLYYLLRTYLHESRISPEERRRLAQEYDAESGITSVESPGRIDVNAQVLELSKFRPERIDRRIHVSGIEMLAQSDAIIVNIDYPLGMAAYHHLTQLAQGTGKPLGVYVMGKAATLNGRVGDVMISQTIYDEHSKNTYLFRNAFAAGDVEPYMSLGTVLDNQKAVTVRSAYLQNRDYMSVFYDEGYTVMEMEAGPYLSAVFELVDPRRHPNDEIVHMSNRVPFDVGIIHYASDTPYSRRQSLLSKSMSYFGVDSTYACTIAIARRIFQREVARLRHR